MKIVREKVWKIARSYMWSIGSWLSFAPVISGEDKVRLLERGIHTSYWNILLVNAVWVLTAAILTPPVFAIVHRVPISKPLRWRRIAGYVFGALAYTIVAACIRWIIWPPWNSPAQHFEQRSLHGLITSLFIYADLIWDYGIILAAAHAFEYFRRAKDQEVERAELQQALAASELHALKSQIHPHFLFNTLHGIAALIDLDRPRAKALVVKMSSLLRTALQYGSSDLITLDQELRFIEDYLDLEKMRLENRLDLRWLINADTRSVLVPQLILQPLVENAILHGVACCREGGWVEVTSRRTNSAVEIQVRNSVSGKRQEGTGLGLQNTRARLKYLYSNEASFSFDVSSDDVATARLVLPRLSLQTPAVEE